MVIFPKIHTPNSMWYKLNSPTVHVPNVRYSMLGTDVQAISVSQHLPLFVSKADTVSKDCLDRNEWMIESKNGEMRE